MSESDETRQNELRTLYQLGQESGEIKRGMKIPYMVLPTGSQMINLEKLGGEPAWKRACVRLRDLPSFARYVKAHGTEATALFAEPMTGRFQAVLDYHEPGRAGAAGWKEHVANLLVPFTPEWERWVKFNRTMLNQGAFADFIDENMTSILKPDGAAMLEITRSLTARITSEFTSVIRGAGESRSALEVRDATSGSGMLLPETVEAAVAVFKGFTRFSFTARLRVQVENKKLSLGYVIPNLDRVMDAAHGEILAAVRQQTGLEPLLGTHE